MVVPVMLQDVENFCVFAAAFSVLLFTAQWTFSSPWWRDPVGRTVVAKDVALLVLLVPACCILVDPHLVTPLQWAVIGTASTGGIFVVMAWRCVVWWRIRKPWPFRPRADKDS